MNPKEPCMLLLNDIHISKDNIPDFSLNWNEALSVCKRMSIQTIVLGGDLFFSRSSQTLDVLLLFLRNRKMGIVILEELHTFAGGEVAGAMGQPSGISAALHVGRNKNQFCHVSSGNCRWTSWASSNLI